MITASKMFVVLGAVLSILCLTAAPAFAEFLSTGSTGEGEIVELVLKAGGGTVTCQNFLGVKGLKWTIEKEGKTSTKGHGLLLGIEKWGKCTIESSEITKTAATLSTCELEGQQTGVELEILSKLIKNCTIISGSCEIKEEATENQALKFISLATAGPESALNENLFLESKITNVATKTNGLCKGITSSTEGKLTGYIEADTVKSTALEPEFTIIATRTVYKANANEKTGRVIVKNNGGAAQVPDWTSSFLPGNSFSQMGEATCRERTYTTAMEDLANSLCSFTIEFKNAGGVLWFVSGRNRNTAVLHVGGE